MSLIEILLKITITTILSILVFLLYDEVTFKSGLAETNREIVSLSSQANEFLTSHNAQSGQMMMVFSNSDLFATTLKPVNVDGLNPNMMKFTKLGTIIHIMPDMRTPFGENVKSVELIYDNNSLGKLPASKSKVIAECISVVNTMLPITKEIMFQSANGFIDGKNEDGSEATMKDVVNSCNDGYKYFNMKVN